MKTKKNKRFIYKVGMKIGPKKLEILELYYNKDKNIRTGLFKCPVCGEDWITQLTPVKSGRFQSCYRHDAERLERGRETARKKWEAQKEKEKIHGRKCSICNKTLSLSKFNIKDKKRGTYYRNCKVCQAKKEGVKRPGLLVEREEKFKQGFHFCSTCNKYLKIENFSKSKNMYRGLACTCKKCAKKLAEKYREKVDIKTTDAYFRHLASSRYNIPVNKISDEVVNLIRLEQEIKKEMVISFDGLEFKTYKSFSEYIHKKYGIPKTTVIDRLQKGFPIEECILTRKEFLHKHMKNLKVTDMETGEVSIYGSVNEFCKIEQVSMPTTMMYLKEGKIRKPYLNSKNRKILKYEMI